MQYLKTFETLAIESGRNGIDIMIDMGIFQHLDKKQELLECERTFNVISRNSKSSILSYYYDRDLKVLDATLK